MVPSLARATSRANSTAAALVLMSAVATTVHVGRARAHATARHPPGMPSSHPNTEMSG